MTFRGPSIIVHGGAGSEDPRERIPRRHGCLDAVRRGWAELAAGRSAITAVVVAVAVLEDDPHFNAGTGSCLTDDGRVEMDASVMDGTTLAAGAVGAVAGVRNPIRLAEAVMEHGRHVLLVGAHARSFARDRGVALCDPEALIVQRGPRQAGPGGETVGAVAVDAAGRLAAATSTGGIAGKLAGRVGDSAIIGAGTYADDVAGAASATGPGEPIMRLTLARLAIDLLRDGQDPGAVAERALGMLYDRLGARCGLILVDRRGRIGAACTADAMPVAYMQSGLANPVVPDADATTISGEATEPPGAQARRRGG
jgi:beta-aspartyl-peptidase (threonine type)